MWTGGMITGRYHRSYLPEYRYTDPGYLPGKQRWPRFDKTARNPAQGCTFHHRSIRVWPGPRLQNI